MHLPIVTKERLRWIQSSKITCQRSHDQYFLLHGFGVPVRQSVRVVRLAQAQSPNNADIMHTCSTYTGECWIDIYTRVSVFPVLVTVYDFPYISFVLILYDTFCVLATSRTGGLRIRSEIKACGSERIDRTFGQRRPVWPTWCWGDVFQK